MAKGDEGLGTGTTVTFPGTITITAQIRDISIEGVEVGEVDMSHLGSTTWKKIVTETLKDPGSVTLNCWFKPGETPPVGNTGVVTIHFPEGSTYAGSAAVRRFGAEIPTEGGMSATYELRYLGTPTAPTMA